MDKLSDVARLARIQLSAEESEKFQHQLTQILEFFGVIGNVDTEGVEPMYTPFAESANYRVDEVKDWEIRDEALEQAPQKSGNLYQVPPVV